MKVTYALIGIDEGGNSVLDHELTAEQVIPILTDALYKLRKPADVEQEPVVHVEVAAPTGNTFFPKPAKTKKVKAPVGDSGTQSAGVSDAVKLDINAGMKAGDIAKTHGLTVGMVYKAKHIMKKNGELQPAEKKEKQTEHSLDYTPPFTIAQYAALKTAHFRGGVPPALLRMNYPKQDVEEIKKALDSANFDGYIAARGE